MNTFCEYLAKFLKAIMIIIIQVYSSSSSFIIKSKWSFFPSLVDNNHLTYKNLVPSLKVCFLTFSTATDAEGDRQQQRVGLHLSLSLVIEITLKEKQASSEAASS